MIIAAKVGSAISYGRCGNDRAARLEFPFDPVQQRYSHLLVDAAVLGVAAKRGNGLRKSRNRQRGKEQRDEKLHKISLWRHANRAPIILGAGFWAIGAKIQSDADELPRSVRSRKQNLCKLGI
jgi:hypothetical protein